MAYFVYRQIKLNIRRAPHANVLLLKRTAENRNIGVEMEGNVVCT